MLENPDIPFEDVDETTTTPAITGMQTELTTAYGNIIVYDGDPTPGKEFKVSYVPASGEGATAVLAHYTVEYTGKQSGEKGNIKYFVTSTYGVQTKSVTGA